MWWVNVGAARAAKKETDFQFVLKFNDFEIQEASPDIVSSLSLELAGFERTYFRGLDLWKNRL